MLQAANLIRMWDMLLMLSRAPSSHNRDVANWPGGVSVSRSQLPARLLHAVPALQSWPMLFCIESRSGMARVVAVQHIQALNPSPQGRWLDQASTTHYKILQSFGMRFASTWIVLSQTNLMSQQRSKAQALGSSKSCLSCQRSPCTKLQVADIPHCKIQGYFSRALC